jgi:hypothetical protein
MTRRFVLFLVVVVLASAVVGGALAASGIFVLRGTVTDLAGRAVEGAEVFIYDSTNTRRPAEYISPKTGRDGRYAIELPEGKYWAVARVRQGEKFGPLQLGTRHSGEPAVIQPYGDSVLEQDFSVADIRELAQNRQREKNAFTKVSGRVLDADGKPVADGYVFAQREKAATVLPDFISTWTDRNGQYLLYLPTGRFYLGAATDFPPPPGVSPERELSILPDKIGVAINFDVTLK